MRGSLCAPEIVEPFRRTVRDRGVWHAVGMIAFQVAFLAACVVGALWLGTVQR